MKKLFLKNAFNCINKYYDVELVRIYHDYTSCELTLKYPLKFEELSKKNELIPASSIKDVSDLMMKNENVFAYLSEGNTCNISLFEFVFENIYEYLDDADQLYLMNEYEIILTDQNPKNGQKGIYIIFSVSKNKNRIIPR